MRCSKCKYENPDGSKFCLECGSKIDLHCPQCGINLPLTAKFCNECGHNLTPSESHESTNQPVTERPVSFTNDRYQIKDLLGEGGKKKVYRAYDTLLERDVALALIKSEGLHEDAKSRITREAQAMDRMGTHPNAVCSLGFI